MDLGTIGIIIFGAIAGVSLIFLLLALSLRHYMDRRRKTAALKWNRPITTSLAVRGLTKRVWASSVFYNVITLSGDVGGRYLIPLSNGRSEFPIAHG